MAPTIEVSEDVLKGLDNLGVDYSLQKNININTGASDNFIYVPSLKLYVAKERSHLGKDWLDSHKKLQGNGERMLTIPEFVEVLKYTRENAQDIYNEITQVRNPWRAEWLDADFKMKDEKLYLNSKHVYDKQGNLNPQSSQLLQKNILRKNKTPGINLENWISNPTKQGLPRKDAENGNLYYWAPMEDNNSVAGFNADSGRSILNCNANPSNRCPYLGVRAVRHE